MQFSSVQFSHSVMSDPLRPHGLRYARLPCPSIMPRAYSDSGWLSRWCHPTISLSVIPFSSSLQPFQLQSVFKWVSSSNLVAKVLEFQFQPHSCQWIFRTGFLYSGLDLLTVQGVLKSLLQQHSSKVSIIWPSAFLRVHLSHPYMTTGKAKVWLVKPLLAK